MGNFNVSSSLGGIRGKLELSLLEPCDTRFHLIVTSWASGPNQIFSFKKKKESVNLDFVFGKIRDNLATSSLFKNWQAKQNMSVCF